MKDKEFFNADFDAPEESAEDNAEEEIEEDNFDTDGASSDDENFDTDGASNSSEDVRRSAYDENGVPDYGDGFDSQTDYDFQGNYDNDEDYYDEWLDIVKPILLSDEFQKRLKFKHHHHSVFFHCVLVSYGSFRFGLKHNVDSYNCAIAGLLHDFYPNPWQYSKDLEKMDSKYIKNLEEKKN